MTYWREELSIGIPLVDEQLKELFKQVGILLDGGQPSRVDSTLSFLKDYVVEHFTTEETIQNRISYPLRIEHKAMHDDFVITLRKLRREYFENGADALVLARMTGIVLNWLNEHVGVHDRKFGIYFKQVEDAKNGGLTSWRPSH